MDYELAAKGAQLNFVVGYEVAQQTEAPTWNAGDSFGTTFEGKK